MKQAVLLGDEGTKRTLYFRQAAAMEKLPVLFAEWSSFHEWLQHSASEDSGKDEWFLKIDPPLWKSCCLEDLDGLTKDYIQKLEELAGISLKHRIEFLNHPYTIIQLLDKRECKQKLQSAGLAVTQMLEEKLLNPHTAGHLLELMRKCGIFQVFIKPVNGSGAAGVSALRWQPAKNRMVLYTCALEHPRAGLVNTKQLRCFTKTNEIMSLLNSILQMDCVVERWYAKAQHQGFSYDLSDVVLDGRTEFLLGRLSKGPITNLHLNNHPLAAKELEIPASVLADIEELCERAVSCYEGLRCAGIDILLERGSLKPRIIEMNAQGDLIYQDIFHENRIYRRQAKMMTDWLKLE